MQMGKSVALGALAAAGVFALVGCQSGVTSTPDAGGSGVTTTGSGPSSGAASKQAGVGSTITLKSNQEGLTVATTLVKIVSPAKAVDEFTQPGAGMRFVAVQFRLKNTGTVTYDDSPSNGATALDSQGQQFHASAYDTRSGPSFPSVIKIGPGSTALGYITFEVPTATKVTKVQFGLDSGFADQTGEWTVG
jgi:Domain of unknown function (DUF4352)